MSWVKRPAGLLSAMLGYPGMCHFPGYTFCPKILKQGNILLGNRPNAFVERMMLSQNQPYCLKSGKIYISISKITENVGKFQN